MIPESVITMPGITDHDPGIGDHVKSESVITIVRNTHLHPHGMRVFGPDTEKAMEVVPDIAFPACSPDVFDHAQARRYTGGNFTLEEWDYKEGCHRVVNCGWTCGRPPALWDFE